MLGNLWNLLDLQMNSVHSFLNLKGVAVRLIL